MIIFLPSSYIKGHLSCIINHFIFPHGTFRCPISPLAGASTDFHCTIILWLILATSNNMMQFLIHSPTVPHPCHHSHFKNTFSWPSHTIKQGFFYSHLVHIPQHDNSMATNYTGITSPLHLI